MVGFVCGFRGGFGCADVDLVGWFVLCSRACCCIVLLVCWCYGC